MPWLDLFDLVVAENGAVMYDPANQEEQALDDAPPPAFVERLRELGVASLWVGRVIVATWEPNEGKVLSAVHDLGLNLEITFNKGAFIVLPVGVTKASGFARRIGATRSVAAQLHRGRRCRERPAFLDVCELPVAVANALPSVKEHAAFVTTGMHGAGVAELIDQLLATDPPSLAFRVATEE
jgi:hydroxymethylpyrimidine pyrophosphatase-like HAD family hydrolase